MATLTFMTNEALANWSAIKLLTDRPGSSVVVTAAGLDYLGDPCASVIVRGDWTPDQGITFTGEDHMDALSNAVMAYDKVKRK